MSVKGSVGARRGGNALVSKNNTRLIVIAIALLLTVENDNANASARSGPSRKLIDGDEW
jgi:hypothetical protein